LEGINENHTGNFYYYTNDKQNTIEMCNELLKVNEIHMSKAEVIKRKDTLTHIYPKKKEQPEIIYCVYI
jgi:hypothetical protein